MATVNSKIVNSALTDCVTWAPPHSKNKLQEKNVVQKIGGKFSTNQGRWPWPSD